MCLDYSVSLSRLLIPSADENLLQLVVGFRISGYTMTSLDFDVCYCNTEESTGAGNYSANDL